MRLNWRLWAACLVCALLFGPFSALGQSSPGWTLGQVPSASQWNAAFASKLDFNPSGCPISAGCTGATTAAGARANLSAAQSGANGDITSLTALTTPLSVQQGGTGSTTAAAARTTLGLGSISTQSAASVAITGGAIDGATIGSATPAAGTFTALLAQSGAAREVDVRAYGATCDGLNTHDDGPAFQLAVNAAGSGGKVVFPSGCYINTAVNVTTPMTIQGVGPGASLYDPTVNAFDVTASDVTFRGFYVYGNRSASTSNIAIAETNGSARLMLEDIRCELVNTCFDIKGGYFHQAYNIRMRNVVTAGFDLEQYSGAAGVELLASGIQYDTDTGSYSMPTEGPFWQQDFAGLVLGHADLIHCGLACVAVTPSSLRAGDDLIGSTVYFDEGGTNGLLLDPTGTGSITRMEIQAGWISTQTRGIYETGTGQLDDINIRVGKIYNQQNEAIKDDNSSASGGSQTIRGTQFNGNNTSNGGYSDINLAPSGATQGFQIDHNTFDTAGSTATTVDNILLNSADASASICGNDSSWTNATGSYIATANSAPAPHLGCTDFATQTINASSNIALPTGSGLLLLDDVTTGDDCMFLLGGNSAVLVSQTQGTTCVASTTPSTSQLGVGWTGSTYAIYNGFTSSRTVNYRFVEVRAFN